MERQGSYKAPVFCYVHSHKDQVIIAGKSKQVETLTFIKV